MKYNFKSPTTKVGKEALDASILFISLMIINQFICLKLPNILYAGIGFTSFLYSLSALIKYKDKSIWLLLPIISGVYVIIWTLLGQVIIFSF